MANQRKGGYEYDTFQYVANDERPLRNRDGFGWLPLAEIPFKTQFLLLKYLPFQMITAGVATGGYSFYNSRKDFQH